MRIAISPQSASAPAADRPASTAQFTGLNLATHWTSRAAALYGTPEQGVEALARYSDEELAFLTSFLRGSAAYQERLLRRLEALAGRDAGEGSSPATAD